MGINNDAHYRATSIDKWHTLGHDLAPKAFWMEFFPHPGLQTLTIRQIPRTDEFEGHVEITIQPSIRINPGVYLAVNDHYNVGQHRIFGADRATEVLRSRWSQSSDFSERVFSKIAEQL
jgi:hypothetical protein